MAVAEGLAAKVGLSLGTAGVGATGIYFGNNYLNDYVYISKYERALIEFLNDHEENDIVFEVKKGENAGTDLVDGDITFSGDGNSSPIKVNVKVTIGDSSLKKGNNSSTNGASNIDEIKKLGNGNSWTWECPFNFSLEGTAPTSEQIKDKDRIFKDGNKGLFGILKKGISGHTDTNGSLTKKGIKKVKEGFIRQCGNQRLVSKNKELSQADKQATDEEIKIPVTKVNFVSYNGALVPKTEDKATFDYWFKDDFKDRQHATGS